VSTVRVAYRDQHEIAQPVAYSLLARLLPIDCANTWLPKSTDTAVDLTTVLPRLHFLTTQLMAQWQDAGAMLPYLRRRCDLCSWPGSVDDYS
jgi:hypothetical protein